MIKKIKRWWLKHEEYVLKKQNERVTLEAMEEYNVTEKHGNMYLVAGSRAIAKIEKDKTVADVIEIINQARHAQIDFKKNEHR